MPALNYDPLTDRLRSRLVTRNWAICMVVLNVSVAFVLFAFVQIRWTLVEANYLSSTADSFRGFATIYAFESLIVVAVLNRHRYAAYFNHLHHVDRCLLRYLDIAPNVDEVRRGFWRFATWLLSNYIVISIPLSVHVYGSKSLAEAAFMFEYGLMAIWMGLTSGFLRYAAHCCLVRLTCVRIRLAQAVGAAGNRRDVHVVILAMDEMDAAKQMLNDGFNMLLTWKLGVDGLNTILSVYLIIFKVFNNGGIFTIQFVELMFYEMPYLIADILMVLVYHNIGVEVS